MIKPSSAMREETREAMRGGNGATRIRHLFEPGEYKGHARLMAKIILPPGASIGLHEHKDEEELFYVVKGRGLVTDERKTREVGPGDAIMTGGGNSHAIENVGNEELEFVAVILTY